MTQPLTVKFADGRDDVLNILSIPFGGVIHGGRDYAREYFSPRTNVHRELVRGTMPLLYDHGEEPTLKKSVIGVADADSYHQDDLGWWVDAQLDRHHKYYSALKALIAKEALYGSTASPTALNRKAVDGEILDWWPVEQTLTPIPCNILSVVAPAVARKHYQDAGLPSPAWLPDERIARETKAMTEQAYARLSRALSGLGLALDGKASGDTGYNPDDNELGAKRSDFAYIDAQGRGHLPLHDAAHARAALARFNQTGIPESAKPGAWRKVLAACKKFGIDVADTTMPKHARGFETKAMSQVNMAHAKAAHDHLAAMGMDGGADFCKGGMYTWGAGR